MRLKSHIPVVGSTLALLFGTKWNKGAVPVPACSTPKRVEQWNKMEQFHQIGTEKVFAAGWLSVPPQFIKAHLKVSKDVSIILDEQ